MRNGKSIRRIGKDRCRNLSDILLFILVVVSFAGCRSSGKIVEESRKETAASIECSVTADTLRAAFASREDRCDTAEVRADGHAAISISRDSAGRVVGITARTQKIYHANNTVSSQGDRWFYGLNATRSSETSRAVASVDQKKKETEKETDRAICVSRFAGIAVLMILIAYVVDYLYRRWEERR